MIKNIQSLVSYPKRTPSKAISVLKLLYCVPIRAWSTCHTHTRLRRIIHSFTSNKPFYEDKRTERYPSACSVTRSFAPFMVRCISIRKKKPSSPFRKLSHRSRQLDQFQPVWPRSCCSLTSHRWQVHCNSGRRRDSRPRTLLRWALEVRTRDGEVACEMPGWIYEGFLNTSNE